MLNLGCALNHEPGCVNLDLDARTHPDVLHDLEVTPLPFREASFETIIGSHVFEHIARDRLCAVVADLYRILTPGGHLIAVTPHGASDDSWDNPHHAQQFSDITWAYFSRRLYDPDGYAHAGRGAYQGADYGAWRIVYGALVPYPAFVDDPELQWKARHLRNIIQEVHVVLQKPREGEA